MAYRRRRRYAPRRRRKGGGVWGAVKKVGGMAIKALSMLNSEEKNITNVYSSTAQTTTPVFTLLNGLTQGTTNVTRVGDEARWTNMYIRMGVKHNGAGGNAQFFRYLIVRDNQTNGAIFSASNLLLNSADVFSPLNLDYTKRFKVLKDQIVSLSASGNEARYVKVFLDFNKKGGKGASNAGKQNLHRTEYGLGNLGTVADIATGSYYMITMASAATGPLCEWTCRMRYIDN